MRKNFSHFPAVFAAISIAVACPLLGTIVRAEEDAFGQISVPVDATTLNKKVLCGYQGWFRCEGDAAREGWVHWSRDRNAISPGSLTVEMWPDMREYRRQDQYPAKGFLFPDKSQATLFSSVDRGTVELHFKWMQQYGIDGVFLQRFLVNLRNPSTDLVLDHVRKSAAETGRVYAIGYDLTGMREDQLLATITEDWRHLVTDERIVSDPQYLKHGGKPVVFVWGFFSDRFSAEVANQIVEFFKQDGPHVATIIGGVPWHWRQERDAEWAKVFRKFDSISPWNVGNVSMEEGKKQAATNAWKGDLAEAKATGMSYLPVLYPGFGWKNLKGAKSAGDTIPRLGGEFFWRQFVTARHLEIDMAYVAMFDEVDEATAIFKVSNSPPTQAKFESFEGLPSDWYLRLTAEGAKVIRGESKAENSLPIRP